MWFKVDDSFHSHPKAAAASLAALGLWAVAGAWSGDHLTDGFVPDHMIPLLSRGQATLADELVTAGLWKRSKGGYRFHQWDERNPTRDEVTAERGSKSIGGAIGNHRRWHVAKGRTDPKCVHCQQKPGSDNRSVLRSDKRGHTESHPNPPDPTRPDPSSGNGTYVPQGRNARDPDRAPPSDGPPSRVETLIAEYRDNSPRGLPSRQAEKLAAEIHVLIGDGYTDLEIRAGLGQLRVRKLGPAMLAALVDELANGPRPTNVVALRTDRSERPSVTDQRVGAGLGLADHYDRLDAEGGPA